MKRILITLFFSSLLSISMSAHGQLKLENQPNQASAQKTKFVEGQHFTRLEEPLKIVTGDKIEVRELFWYGCPHCNRLEPVVLNWLKTKPANSEFVPMPAVFSQRWIFHAKVFYTLKALGIEKKAHPEVFTSIHAKKRPINNIKQLNKFLKANYDIDQEKVENAFKSFTVDSNMRAANAYSLKSSATGVPTVIVDGKFKVTVNSAGGNQQLFNVVDELIVLAQSERK